MHADSRHEIVRLLSENDQVHPERFAMNSCSSPTSFTGAPEPGHTEPAMTAAARSPSLTL